jgi:hypothetical protein
LDGLRDDVSVPLQWSTFPIALAVLTTSGVERGDGGAAGAKGAGGTSPQNPSLAAELGAGESARKHTTTHPRARAHTHTHTRSEDSRKQ